MLHLLRPIQPPFQFRWTLQEYKQRFATLVLSQVFSESYQINIVIPPGAVTSAGANVRIFEGYAQTHPKVTIPIR
jgi:hypothetical protein